MSPAPSRSALAGAPGCRKMILDTSAVVQVRCPVAESRNFHSIEFDDQEELMRNLVVAMAALICASSTHAVVLCARQKADGTYNASVKIRETCRTSEQTLDTAVL